MTGTPAELNWFYITGDSYAKLNTYIFLELFGPTPSNYTVPTS